MICPIMSRPQPVESTGNIDLFKVDCQKENCQWWWKCKEPVSHEVEKYKEMAAYLGCNDEATNE